MSTDLGKIPLQNGLKLAIDGRQRDRGSANRLARIMLRRPIKAHQTYNKCLTLIGLYCLLLIGCTPLDVSSINSGSLDSGSLDSGSLASAASQSQTSYTLSNTVVAAEPNNINIVVVDGLATLEIESPKGFGSVQFELAEVEAGNLDEGNGQGNRQRLERLALKFHLSSLEQLRIVTPDVILTASVSGNDSTALFQELSTRLEKEGAASDADNEKPAFGEFQSLTSDSPFWLDIQANSGLTQSADGQSKSAEAEKTNSAEAQTISVTLPTAFIQTVVTANEGGEIIIEWIDFYR